MKKRIISILSIVLITVGTIGGTTFASNTNKIDSKETQLNYVEEKETTMVPLRPSLELLGVNDLMWIQEGRKIIFKINEDDYVVNIDSAEVLINGKAKALTSTPKLKDGVTLLPIDFFRENLSINPSGEIYQKIYSLTSSHIDETISFEQNLRQNIVNTALKYVGAPYKWGATGPNAFDSSGLIWSTYKNNGINLPRVSFDMYSVGESISKEELLPGDIVFFQGYKKGPSHATIFAGEGKFIHSPSAGKTVSIDNLLSDKYYWIPRYYGARRFINVK